MTVPPSSVVFGSEQPTRVSTSHSGKRIARTTGSHRWRLEMVWREGTVYTTNMRPIHAFVEGLRGQADSCTVVVPGRSTPLGTWTGTPLVRGAHTTGTRKAISATVHTGGTGGTPGTATVTGTTGTGAKVTVNVTINGSGVMTAVNYIIQGGEYTVDPGTTGEPVTGGGLTGAKLNLTMESWGGSTVLIDGLTYPQSAPCKAGDLLKFAGMTKVYQLSSDAAVDASGNATLLITPALTGTLADNAGITTSEVPITMALEDDRQSVSIGGAFAEGFSVRLIEVI